MRNPLNIESFKQLPQMINFIILDQVIHGHDCLLCDCLLELSVRITIEDLEGSRGKVLEEGLVLDRGQGGLEGLAEGEGGVEVKRVSGCGEEEGGQEVGAVEGQ